MELKDYLTHWQQTLSGSGPDTQTARNLTLPLDRLKLYRSFVQSHYQDALTKMYPLLLKTAPEVFSQDLIQAYYDRYAPTAYELNQLTRHFADFLKAQGKELYLSELAEYEWAEFSVFLSPEEETLTQQALKKNEVTLHPALYILNFENRISDWVEKIRVGEKTSTPETQPEVLILSREVDPFEVTVTEPSPVALFLIQGLTLGPKHRDSLVKELEIKGLNNVDLYSELEFLIEQKVVLSDLTSELLE